MNDHIRGNPKASVTLIEYADFECPYCGMAAPYFDRIAKRFPSEVAEIFRPFPLVQIHPHALRAALAAEAAGFQNKFWEMHDVLFAHQRKLDDAALLEYAAHLKLDVERFERDIAGKPALENVENSVRAGEQQGVRGTPSFFLNGALMPIEDYDDIELFVARAVARSKPPGEFAK